tara:strand:- start:335 stop:520 length:186 start_codon:yes stop_codon:yes gene_type:complete
MTYLYKASKNFLAINKLTIIKINRYELLMSIFKSILKRNNKYKVNGIVMSNGIMSLNKKDK